MRFTEALELMRKNPLEVYHRRDSDEQWRWFPSEEGAPRGYIQSRFDDGKWDNEVCIDQRDLDSNAWQVYEKPIENKCCPDKTPWQRLAELNQKVAKLEELIGDTVAVLEKHRDQFDDMDKKISNLEAYHPIITSNLLRLSLRLDKVEDSKYE